MNTALRNLILGATLALGAGVCSAADKDEAARAAQHILATLQQQQFEQLWDSQTSEFFKRQITRESFIENLTLGRQQLGAPGASAFMQVTMATSDPASGYTGEIYVFNYRNAYASGEYLERIVVVKDDDGEFRLSGLWAAALPQQPVAQQ